MSFQEATKLKVKKLADFTCCWCRDPRNKGEVHHIIPQAENGPDTEDNAALLCSNCHTLFGGNPELRKEVKDRRDHWYEICLRKLEFVWPIGLHVPLLDSFEEVSPPIEKSAGGTDIVEGPPRLQLTDTADGTRTSSLYLSVSLDTASSISLFPRILLLQREVALLREVGLES